MELAVKHSLCHITFILLTFGSCQSQFYKHVMTSLHVVINNSRHNGFLDVRAVSAQLGLGPNYDASALSFERIMTEYTRQEKQSAESECSRQINATVEALFKRQDWAIRMADSSGKIPAGLLLGNLHLTGSYDECVNITAKVKVTEGQDTIKGQYCRAGFQITPRIDPGVRFGPDDIPLGDLNVGLCVPDTCSQQDVQDIINGGIKLILKNSTLRAEAVICQPESQQLTAGAIAVILVLSLLGFFIVVGTAYDVFIIQKLHQAGEEEEADGEESKPLIGEEADNQVEGEQSRNIQNRSYGARGGPEQQVITTDMQEPAETGTLGKLLLAFSLYTNVAKILATDIQKGTVGSLNGIRFISMTWVMLGHSYAFCAFYSQNIGVFVSEALNSVSFMAVLNGTLAVDTFFLLSGLLVGLLTLRELNRAGGVGKISWIMYYVHRLWRLTPPYMLTLMFYVVLFQYWYDGPFWPQQGIEEDYCRNSWWQNLLYINNFFKDGGCMVWSWYLANDMQFYIISPLLVVPLYISGILGGVVCLIVLVASWIVSGVLSSVNNYPMGIFGAGDISKVSGYFQYIYVRPYTRIGPYIVGMLTGFILYKTGGRVKMPRVVNLVGWMVAAACCLSVVYGNHEHLSGRHFSSRQVVALYTALHRSVWALGVCWVIFACATGHGGLVNRFLSWSVFIPLSRLTYLAYLVHPVVMEVFYLGMRQALYVTHVEIACRFLAYVVVSYAVAFVLSLAFESPFMGIERALRSGRQRAK